MKKIMFLALVAMLTTASVQASTYQDDKKCNKECCRKNDKTCKENCKEGKCSKEDCCKKGYPKKDCCKKEKQS